MSLFRVLSLLSAMWLAACGFTPVHKSMESDSEFSEKLAAIEIVSSHDLIGQSFKTNLDNLLNPTSSSIAKKHKMVVKVTKSEVPLAIQEDRTITRYKVILNANYVITDIETGEKIDSGDIRRDGGYDKVDSDYATYISEEDTTKRIIKELAEDAKIRIISVMLNI